MSEHSPGIIRRFFGGIWKLVTWVRVTVLNLLFLLIALLVVASLWPEPGVEIKENTALVIAPTGILVDERSYVDPMAQLLEQNNKEESETVVSDVIEAIEAAKHDSRVKEIVLELDGFMGGGISKLEEIGDALDDFKASGKPIRAYSSNYSQHQYLLAVHADEIHINPMGSVLLTGFSRYRNYFKGALDKLAINMHVFRVGNFKDAMEPFMRENMSESSREHNEMWLNELWSVYTSEVEALRDLPTGAVNEFVNDMDVALQAVNGDTAKLALNTGLVDKISTHKDWESSLINEYGKDEKKHTYKGLSYQQYLSAMKPATPHLGDHIAIIVASGTISDGHQPAGNIGDKSFQRLLEQVEEDQSIKAVVVRIDSGGGSAYASEEIRQGLLDLKEQGIPVIVSMGSVAASGGYWMATAADEIWATPTTITGSIGVFGAFPTLEGTLEKAGITTDGLGTTKLAGALRADRPLDPMAQRVIQEGVNHIYQQFLALVAEARNTTPEAVHNIAQGRVWSGTKALELGLVDKLGTLNEAVEAAAKLAGTSDFRTKTLQLPLTPAEEILRELNKAASVNGIPTEPLGTQWIPQSLMQYWQSVMGPWQLLDTFNDRRGVYAVCMECELSTL
ncbi:signal peptide peptidase SppA [Marinibactrum halimedae]|uniref:Protease n=1 Tax=Marinibactrum halimedae TaxID=1444977 RepID=A0AA37WMU8_9GAMM|nr:signal peptide peptidase SppA [Marinibactrum halimedae]MCD9457486.1 signal peptide peptidase SppA [Marinibactrum halimedae]GLS25461.1 protease [Marinibactrum halimedae]